MTKPRISLLSPAFKYTSANATDVAKTFARVRAELEAAAKGAWEPTSPPPEDGFMLQTDVSGDSLQRAVIQLAGRRRP